MARYELHFKGSVCLLAFLCLLHVRGIFIENIFDIYIHHIIFKFTSINKIHMSFIFMSIVHFYIAFESQKLLFYLAPLCLRLQNVFVLVSLRKALRNPFI